MTEIKSKTIQKEKDEINKSLLGYRKPQTGKAVWQLINTLVPYAALWSVMVYLLSTGVAFWYILPL
ncbi:MAG: hypothetical protein P8048_13360, partial [Calditrichia bacterium]